MSMVSFVKKKNHISPNLFPLFKSLSHASLLYTRIHYSLPCHCLSTVLWPFILIQGNSHQQTRRKIPILADDSFLCCHISYCSIFSIKILLEQKKRKKKWMEWSLATNVLGRNIVRLNLKRTVEMLINKNWQG